MIVKVENLRRWIFANEYLRSIQKFMDEDS